MAHYNNIIPFPKAAAVGRGGRTDALPQRDAQVIALSARQTKDPLNASGIDPESPHAALHAIDIWLALNDDRVVIHYQPQYDLRSGETVAAEALVRLIDTSGQLIYPKRFIGVAERSDLIVPLGRAVIAQVCADLAACRAQGLAMERIAVNLAALQLERDGGLLEFIDLQLQRHGLEYRDLEFELTERQNLTPQRAGIAQLKALATRGSRIVLDDFGIGYSSVMYLTELPISAIKLDRALISRLPEDQTSRTVVESLLTLATTLGLEVVAEGIEKPEQEQFLQRAGCPYAQGFGYARPMAIDALQAFLGEDRDLNPDDLELELG